MRTRILTVSCLLFAFGCSHRQRSQAVRAVAIGWSQAGEASWYGIPYHGRRAANGEVYDMEQLTAAHRTLPFDTWVRVKNLSNGKTVDVRITDRGPFVDGRIIDLSRAAAREIDSLSAGVVKVRLTVIRRPKVLPVPHSEPPPAPGPPVVAPGAAPDVASVCYAVQLAAFRDEGRANELRSTLLESEPSARVIPAGTGVWRLVAGNAATPADLRKALAAGRARFSDAFIVRLENAGDCPTAAVP